ncbi:MAG: hypothetical protein KDD66_02355 [Bdellovibrionales bacterium]|nr:hypothetical protein [Bdellovibrionales bacterium]
MNLPCRVVVKETLESRYAPGSKPQSWDDRRPGVEKVRTTDGEELSLMCSGAQSSPSGGWELLLTEKTPTGDYCWTLYGIHP